MPARHTVAWLLLGVAAAATAQEEDYGEMLYANHCTGCHESTVHVRDKPGAASIAELEGFVRRWADYQQLDWGAEQVSAVRDYLNLAYYGLFEDAAPLPPGVSD